MTLVIRRPRLDRLPSQMTQPGHSAHCSDNASNATLRGGEVPGDFAQSEVVQNRTKSSLRFGGRVWGEAPTPAGSTPARLALTVTRRTGFRDWNRGYAKWIQADKVDTSGYGSGYGRHLRRFPFPANIIGLQL